MTAQNHLDKADEVGVTARRSFDPDTMRTKYLHERNKRIRPDGNAQYRDVEGSLGWLDTDPFSSAPAPRVPLTDDVDAIIVGGGFAGLLAGAALRTAGLERIRVIDRAAQFGGTWYWNQYPGAQCDVESYVYLPLLEETGYIPSERYTCGPEILAHGGRIAHHYGLDRDACMQTRVTEINWDEESRMWTVLTDQGDRMRARYVVKTGGFLSRPKLPGIPGIENFRGHAFHTSRWDFGYTGGDSRGALIGLQGKRVGVIGTGASGIQVIPHIAKHAEHLYVFQRTPSAVDERNNRPTDADWASSLTEGWQRRRMESFTTIVSGGQAEDLVNDGWTDIFRKLSPFFSTGDAADLTPEAIAEAMELADFEKMEEIRARVEADVADPAVAEALKPYYRQFCKRPCFSDEYLPTFNRPNVTLVDLAATGDIDRFTENAVVVADVEYPVDCLIFATGFNTAAAYSKRADFDAVGVGGMRLSEKWADGMSTFYGVQTHGFPNLFLVGVHQAGISVSFPHAFQEQAEHIGHLIAACRDKGATRIDAAAEAEQDWGRQMREAAEHQRAYFEACTPGFYNNEGRPGERNGALDGIYGAGPLAYFALLEAWRTDGGFVGVDLD